MLSDKYIKLVFDRVCSHDPIRENGSQGSPID